MNDLEELREKIDELDREIDRLYCRRIDCVRAISALKRQTGAAVRDEAREREILKSASDGSRYPDSSRALFRFILRESRALQQKEREEK
ncbi:MAG: chorismate mutase [Eubacteriales bacterium]|nr:chorismate mutase [Eubacteriales bacterium]